VASPDTIVPMLNEELGAKVLSAAKASKAIALDYAATAKWMPRARLPKLGTYQGGWPSFSPSLVASDDGPRKLDDLFGLKRDSLVPFAYNDVPELVELVTYVQDHPDIAGLFQFRMPDGSLSPQQDVHEVMTSIGAAGLATSVMARADALGIGSDAELTQLYEEREAALLAPSLAVELVVPLTLVDIEHNRRSPERLPVSEHVWIERMQDKLQLARAPVDSSIYAVPSPLAGAAVLAVVVDGLTVKNSQWNRQRGTGFGGLPFDVVDDVCAALRIQSNAQIGYSQVLVRPVGWADHWKHDLPALEEIGRVRRYSPKLDHFGWLRRRVPIRASDLWDLQGVFARLRSAPPRVKLAAKRLSDSAMEPDEPDSAIDACIGIEALVGEEHDELVHRMALRAATALAPQYSPQVIYKAVRSAYNYRSAIVHGTEPSKKKQEVPLPSGGTVSARALAHYVLILLLRSVLGRNGGWTPATLDARLLDSLPKDPLGRPL
jgi:hypothetical protein